MAFIARYSLTMQEVGPNGVGMNAGPLLQGAVGVINGQRLVFFDSGGVGSATFTATDITNILTTMTTDLSAQMNAQISRIQGWSSGGG